MHSKHQILWGVTVVVWLASLGWICLGALAILLAPLSRLGVGEPGTGMSIAEMERLNARIAASPWPPLICAAAGFALLVVPPLLSVLWTRWIWSSTRATHGLAPLPAERTGLIGR